MKASIIVYGALALTTGISAGLINCENHDYSILEHALDGICLSESPPEVESAEPAPEPEEPAPTLEPEDDVVSDFAPENEEAVDEVEVFSESEVTSTPFEPELTIASETPSITLPTTSTSNSSTTTLSVTSSLSTVHQTSVLTVLTTDHLTAPPTSIHAVTTTARSTVHNVVSGPGTSVTMTALPTADHGRGHFASTSPTRTVNSKFFTHTSRPPRSAAAVPMANLALVAALFASTAWLIYA